MKYYGDIPEEHRKLIVELEALENWFNRHSSEIPPLSVAKGFVCIAHDYYFIYLEEEGERFLKLAEKRCPGYFTGPILIHIEKDKDFATLVENLKKVQAIDLMNSLGFDK
jgi:hypothetical protein